MQSLGLILLEIPVLNTHSHIYMYYMDIDCESDNTQLMNDLQTNVMPALVNINVD